MTHPESPLPKKPPTTHMEAIHQIAILDREIDAYPGWGAGLAALIEWREEIARGWGLPRRSNIEP